MSDQTVETREAMRAASFQGYAKDFRELADLAEECAGGRDLKYIEHLSIEENIKSLRKTLKGQGCWSDKR